MLKKLISTSVFYLMPAVAFRRWWGPDMNGGDTLIRAAIRLAEKLIGMF